MFHCYTAASDNDGSSGSVQEDIRDSGGTAPIFLNLLKPNDIYIYVVLQR